MASETIVKLSKRTQNVLKNFATINKSIIVESGSKVRTLSINKNIYASAKITEDFPRQIPIYDLGVFLSGLSLFENPVFDFTHTQKLVTRDEATNATTTFFYDDASIITPALPTKEIEMSSVDVTFDLRAETLSNILRAAAVYKVKDLCVYNKGDKVHLMVCDKKNETSNTYDVPVGKNVYDTEFCFCFKTENIVLLPGDYKVDISSKGISRFTSSGNGVQYFIALEL